MTNLIRCPACSQLSYDAREALCDNDGCRYSAICHECGTTIHPDEHNPDNESFCSAHCRGLAIDGAAAELALDR